MFCYINMKRLLTIVIEVEQPAANWLWEIHRTGKGLHGVCSVHAMANGDQLEERDKIEKELEEMIKEDQNKAWERDTFK